MRKTTLVLCALLAGLAGCKTSEDVAVSMNNQWIGRPASQFFQQNGPPVSSYVAGDGNTIYTWIGGEHSYQRQVAGSFGGIGTDGFSREKSRSRTTTTTTQINPGTTVTRSKTTGSSFSAGISPVGIAFPTHETVHVYCEANLTADRNDRIIAIRINRDTSGAGMSLSRCAELFP